MAVFVRGSSRTLVNRVVFAMARSLDEGPLWLEITERGEEPEALRTGWVPPDRVYVSERVEDLEPSRAVGNLAMWGIVRSDEPATVLAGLTDFVRLPPLIQEALGQSAAEPRLRALAVGNADRIARLLVGRAQELEWLIRYLRDSTLCLVVGAVGDRGATNPAFDCEFEVDEGSSDHGPGATITCARSRIPGSFPVGRAQVLARIPRVRDLFGETGSSLLS